MASSGPNISSDALISFRRYHFVRLWGKEVYLLVYKHLFSTQPKPIIELLKDNAVLFPPDISHKKCRFSDEEIRNLSGKPEGLDITLMNKVCRAIWGESEGNVVKSTYDPGNELKNLMKKIKDERNIVCHEEGSITKEELKENVKSFQTTLKETLDKARSLRPNGVQIDEQKIDTLIGRIDVSVQELQKKIREPLDPQKKEDLDRLTIEISDFWDHLFDYILQLTQEELKSLYGSLCRVLPFDWLAQFGVSDPSRTTISLRMDQVKEFDSQGSNVVDQRDILYAMDPNLREPTAVIISGCAGSGKTTILCYTVEMWCKNAMAMSKLSSFPVLLYMQFRDHEFNSFDEYLKVRLPQTSKRFDLEHIKSAIQSSKCLILCDGYDEANESSRKLFQELITLQCKDMKIVVTTRPGSAVGLTGIINKAKHYRINLSVLGLQSKDMEPLIEKTTDYLKDYKNKGIKDDLTQIEDMKNMKKELLDVIKKMDRTMNTILETPLYFNLFIFLYFEYEDFREKIRKEEISSASAIYIELEKHKSIRITDKFVIQKEFLERFDELYITHSLQYYKMKKYELSDKDVDVMKPETQCENCIQSSKQVRKYKQCQLEIKNFGHLLSSYFNVKSKNVVGIFKNVYCYIHASELEFAAARKISDDIINSYGKLEGNIVECILSSNGLWEMWQRELYSEMNVHFHTSMKWMKSRIYLKQGDIVNLFMFIVGILYNKERDVFYNIIDDIHNSILKLGGLEVFYLLLRPCIETGLDTNVLDSLVRILKSTSAEKKLCIHQTRSLFALPQLLPRLDLKHLEIKIEDHFSGKDFPSLTETVKAATDTTYLHLHLAMDLKDLMGIAQLPGLKISAVDKLDLFIDDDGTVDHNELCSFPISSKDLSVVYNGANRGDTTEVSKIVNAVWPEDASESLSSLEIRWPIKEEEIMPLLESLAGKPLTELSLPFSLVFSLETEIRERVCGECKIKGLEKLTLGEKQILLPGSSSAV